MGQACFTFALAIHLDTKKHSFDCSDRKLLNKPLDPPKHGLAKL